jgi:hypothetical protein
MSTVYQQCGAFQGSGMSGCDARMKKPVGVLVEQPATKYTTAELASIAKTKSNLSLAAGIVSLYIPISEYKDTTDAPEIIKSPSLGTKGKFDDQLPSFTVYMDRSFDDYKSLFGSDNALVNVTLITRDGFRIMTPSVNGTYTGLRAKMNVNAGMPNMDTPMEAFPIEFFFRDFEQFRNMEALPMTGYGAIDLQDATPVGLNLRATGEYNTITGVINLQAKMRGSDAGKAGLTVFKVLSSSSLANVITLVDGGAGNYAVTILKDTTDELVLGDSIWIQGQTVVDTFATYVTTPLQVVVSSTTP